MPRKRHKPEEIVVKFRQVDVLVSQGDTVADAVREGAGELLEDVQLFDVFTGPQIGEDRKSLTFALRFRAPDRTLTDDEANAAHDRVRGHLSARFALTLRS